MHNQSTIPTRVIIGENSVRKNSAELEKLGSRCLIVTGKSSARLCGALDDAVAALEAHNIYYEIFDGIMQNPYLSACVAASEQAKRMNAQFILGIGGGSPLDAAKAIAVLAANDIEPLEAFTPNWENDPLPIALIGTTAGTGSEVTQYAVLTLDESGRKRSIATERCFATIAFGDARYTSSLSPHFTVSTALDSISHCVESYFNNKSNELSEPYAIDGIRIGYATLSAILGKSSDEITLEQRESLYTASIYAGIAIAHTGTAYCHALGYFLTEEYDISHGMACAVFLPSYIERSTKYMPEKAAELESRAMVTLEQLNQLILRATDAEIPLLTTEQIEEIASRSDGSANLAKTPGNMDHNAAVEVLTEIFA